MLAARSIIHSATNTLIDIAADLGIGPAMVDMDRAPSEREHGDRLRRVHGSTHSLCDAEDAMRAAAR